MTPHPGLARTLASGFNYTFEVAIADLIDNSIANGAENVWVYVDTKDGVYKSPRAFVAVVDDGNGLSKKELVKKLEYGYKSDDDPKNLGAFGLGLKTAGSSQSWIVAVASRQSPNDNFVRRAWDIPWIEEIGKWKLRIPKEDAFPEKIMETISSSSGTAVLLPDLTRMKSNMDELTQFNQEQVLAKKYGDCAAYLSVVFHRFISGKCLSEEYSGSKINLFINDVKVEPWDPFMEDHDGHQRFTLDPGLPLTHLSDSNESDSRCYL